MNKVEVFAPTIRHGGGKILLEQLLSALINKNMLEKAYLSDVFKPETVKYDDNLFFFYKSNIRSNIRSYLDLRNYNKNNRRVLFFGNWPPLFPINGVTKLYLHNKLLVAERTNYKLKFSTKIRLKILSKIIQLSKKNIDTILVQTKEMVLMTKKKMLGTKIELRPFFTPKIIKKRQDLEYDFIYSSYGYPYKNHDILLKAWVILANENIYPTLILTLDHKNDENLIRKINLLKERHEIKVFIEIDLTNDEVYSLYSKSRSLIWPSVLESFGLPLIEAVVNGLDIISADLPYIYDILEPSLSFNPYDENDLAEKIKYYNDNFDENIKNSKLNVLVDTAENFVENINWD